MKIDLGGNKRYIPKTLSCSGIKTYKTCPLKFYYQYVLRLKSPSNEYFLRGNIIHAVFERFYNNMPNYDASDLSILQGEFKARAMELLDAEWKKIGTEHEDLFSHEPEQMQMEYEMHCEWIEFFALQQAMKYKEFMRKNNNDYKKMKKYFMPHAVEIPLYDFELGINGRIDAVFGLPYTGKYYPVDYKTSTKSQSYIDEDEELQLYIYAILLKRCMGMICTEGHIYLARTGCEPIISIKQDKMKEVLELCKKASSAYKDGRREIMTRKTNVFCRWCPFSQIECKDIVPEPKIYVYDYTDEVTVLPKPKSLNTFPKIKI